VSESSPQSRRARPALPSSLHSSSHSRKSNQARRQAPRTASTVRFPLHLSKRSARSHRKTTSSPNKFSGTRTVSPSDISTFCSSTRRPSKCGSNGSQTLRKMARAPRNTWRASRRNSVLSSMPYNELAIFDIWFESVLTRVELSAEASTTVQMRKDKSRCLLCELMFYSVSVDIAQHNQS